eukprot:307747-Rhodomonas_salina.1
MANNLHSAQPLGEQRTNHKEQSTKNKEQRTKDNKDVCRCLGMPPRSRRSPRRTQQCKLRDSVGPVSYTHLRAHETEADL